MTTASRSRLEEWLHTDFHWTPRQRQVLQLIARECTNAEIGQELGISLDGAKWHVGEILSKLGANSREDAAAYWRAYNAPRARLARAARALIPTATSAKAVAGAAALGVAGIAVAAVVIALQGGDASTHPGGATTPGATATTTTQPTSTAVASGPTTGISLVDTVIAAVRNKDVASLEPLIDYTENPCATNPQGLGAPPACPPGVREGTPIPAISSASCEGVWVPKSDMPHFLEQSVGNLDGVYSVSRDGAGYVIIFVRTHWADGTAVSGPTVGQAWLLSTKGVTALLSGCGREPASDLAARYPDFIVAPASQAASQPSATIAGCTATDLACTKADEVVAALQIADMESLFVNLQSGPVACPAPGTVRGLGGPYPLCDGASEGELRNGFHITFHGSEEITVNESDFRLMLRDFAAVPGARFLDIGCVTASRCEQFVLAFNTTPAPGVEPQVTYLTYDARHVPDMSPTARLTGMGISGDNAQDFLSSRAPAWTGIGEVEFAHYTPKAP